MAGKCPAGTWTPGPFPPGERAVLALQLTLCGVCGARPWPSQSASRAPRGVPLSLAQAWESCGERDPARRTGRLGRGESGALQGWRRMDCPARRAPSGGSNACLQRCEVVAKAVRGVKTTTTKCIKIVLLPYAKNASTKKGKLGFDKPGLPFLIQQTALEKPKKLLQH